MTNHHPTSRTARAVAARALAAGTAVLAAMGGVVVGVARTAAHDVEHLRLGPIHPPPGPELLGLVPPGVPAARWREAVALAAPAADVPADLRWTFVDGACQAVDAFGALTGSRDDMVIYVLGLHPSFAGQVANASALVDDLADAETSLDRSQVLAQAALCEVAAGRS